MEHEKIEAGLREILSPRYLDGKGCSVELYDYASGQMNTKEAADFELHLQSCAQCRDDLEIFRNLENERIAPDAPRRACTYFISVLAAASIVCLVMLVGLLWPFGRRDFDGDRAGFRIKGPDRLHVAVRRGEKTFKARSGDALRTNDTLGFFYTAPRSGYIVILFADEEGQVSQVYPEKGWDRIDPGVEKALPGGAVMAQGQGCEWLAAFFSHADTPPSVEKAKRFLEKAVRGRIPDCRLDPVQLELMQVDVYVIKRGGE